MKIGSLFSGIGGLELGLERAGLGETVWQCERDPFCRNVLARHWPGVRCFEDVCEVTSETADCVDLLCGGSPCQGFSRQGKRQGHADERSGLWSEFARCIGDFRPRWVVLENSADILDYGWGQVLGDLAACGYDCQWDCIPAAAVGAAHRRDRIFAVAYPLGQRREAVPRVFTGQLATDRAEAAVDVQLTRMGSGRVRRVPDSRVCRVANGSPGRLDRYRSLGNAVVPQCAEAVGRFILQAAS